MKNDICMCVKSNIKQQEMKQLVAALYKLLDIRSTFKTWNGMSYFWKKSRGEGGLRTYFFETPLEFFIYLLYPWKFQANQSSTPGNCTKLYYISLGNSKTKYQDLWKFHIIFSWYPGNSTCYFWYHCPGNSISSTPLLGIFLE